MFLFRQIPRSVTVISGRLLFSSQLEPLVGVSVDDEGIATVQLQRAPVNGLNVELLQAISDTISDVEKDKCKGMILTSALPKVFSAGLDLKEFHKPDVKRLIVMKELIFDVVKKVFGTDLITTVAINGYTGAGACILALPSEYRAMTTGQATIGLNDTAVGIPPAMWIYDLMARAMGPKHAEYAVLSSFMYTAEQALKVGLIDDVAADKTDAIGKCKDFIRSFDHIEPAMRAATKRSIRQGFLTQLDKYQEQSGNDSVELITSATFQDKVHQYIESLKQKKGSL